MESEKQQFEGVLKRAKRDGVSKKKVLDFVKSIRLRGNMMWMMTPVTDPKSKAIKSDIEKTYRLEDYVKRNWSKKKLGKLM